MLSRLIAFLATIYLARTLGPGVYGVVALAGAILVYATHLAEAGIETLGVPAVTRAPAQAAQLLSSLSLARLLVSLALTAVLVALGLVLLPQPEGAILAAFSLALPLRALTARWTLLGLDSARAVAVARVAGELVCAVLVFSLVRGVADLGRVPLTQVAGDAATAIVVLVALRRLGHVQRLSYRHDVAGPVLRESWQLVANAVMALMVFNFDLIALRFFRDSVTVGWYSSAYALISFLSNLGVSFAYSVLPALARLGDSRAAGERGLYQTSLVAAIAITLPLAIGGALTSAQLIHLVYGTGFEPAAAPLRILLAVVPLTWLRLVGQMALIARGRQRDVLLITAGSSLLAVVLDLLVIPRYGMAGAAVVTVAVELVRCALIAAAGASIGLGVPGPLRLWRPLAGAAVMAAVVAVALGRLPVLLVILLGAVIYGAVLLVTGAVRLRPPGLRL